MPDYRCGQCGSQLVQAEAWLWLNTHELADWVETRNYWCVDCNEELRGLINTSWSLADMDDIYAHIDPDAPDLLVA